MTSERFDYFLNQSRVLHATRKVFSGNGVLKHRGRVLTIAQEVGASSALDYGCGKGAQFDVVGPDEKTLEQALGFTVAKFDPAVPAFDAKPEGSFDLVWCTDVLECIPEEDVDEVIAELGAYAAKALFVTVASYPAKKTFADGSNTHVTIKSAQWWRAHINALRRARPDLRIEILVG